MTPAWTSSCPRTSSCRRSTRTPGIPATLSRPILTGLLRDELKFKGLVYTDSMSMYAISKNWTPDKAAAMAVKAGVDFVLHSPDDEAAFKGIKAAVESGEISQEQLNASVERILRVKARLGLHRSRTTDLNALNSKFGGRANAAVNAEICERALTLIKDDRNQVPLKAPKDASVLYLSVIDYPSGWREALPSRTFIPELKKRWPNVTAVEVSDHTTASRARHGARAGAALGCRRRGRVRPDRVLQRADGPAAGRRGVAGVARRPTRSGRS